MGPKQAHGRELSVEGFEVVLIRTTRAAGSHLDRRPQLPAKHAHSHAQQAVCTHVHVSMRISRVYTHMRLQGLRPGPATCLV